MSEEEPTLRALGFCGADDSIHPHQLAILCHAYPLTEFGVLFRPDKAGSPRYASQSWVDRLSQTARSFNSNKDERTIMKLAAHLCGSLVNDVLQGSGGKFLESLVGVFQRVQINATAVNGVDTSQLAESVPILWDTVKQFPQLEFILQKNDETKPLWQGIVERLKDTAAYVTNISMLVDESKGTGVLSSSWPPPSDLYKTGYAGGIGPSNVKDVLKEILEAVKAGKKSKTFWIDMESSLRSNKNGKDVFDLDKCYQVIDAVCDLQLMKRPEYLCIKE